jgi:hypothetical protein
MAQPPRKTETYEAPAPTVALPTSENHPKQVEMYERPARTASVKGIAIVIAVLIAVVLVAVLFLRS